MAATGNRTPGTVTPPLIDIGANLGHESFQHDLDRVLADARAAGIETIMVTGTSVPASEKAWRLARAHPGFLYSTAGVHPHDAESFTPDTPDRLAELAALPEVKALGETGLDFNRDYSPRPAQEKAFEAQLDLAAALRMPLFLHQRDAHERFMHLLLKYRARLDRIIVHCFTGTEDELAAYLDQDAYIGITGWICDERRGRHLHDFLHRIPENRLMLETDAPYLLPRNLKPKPASRRNEPRHLVQVLNAVAEALGASTGDVAKSTTANAKAFFNLQ